MIGFLTSMDEEVKKVWFVSSVLLLLLFNTGPVDSILLTVTEELFDSIFSELKVLLDWLSFCVLLFTWL